MRRIDYNNASVDITLLKHEYLKIFDKERSQMQTLWEPLRDSLRHISPKPDLYKDDINDILIANFNFLAELYCDFTKLVKEERISSDECKDLEVIFHYSKTTKKKSSDDEEVKEDETTNKIKKFQPDISAFFMKHADKLKIQTCHYCEMSYINAYGYKLIYQSVEELLDKASLEDLIYFIPTTKDPLSIKTAKMIINGRPYTGNLEKFDNIHYWENSTVKKSQQIEDYKRNHYDLDHVLPKSKCPIVGLSLFNFVPSCPICNERLKGTGVLGENERQICSLSPTSIDYKFDSSVIISVTPKDTCAILNSQEHPDDFKITFHYSDPIYQKTVDMFHLRERYNYHKGEALRLLDLLQDYSPAQIKMLHNVFKESDPDTCYTEDKIKEDLFGEKFMSDNNRCFAKMKRDIIKGFKK